jgi:hypothetical protein
LALPRYVDRTDGWVEGRPSPYSAGAFTAGLSVDPEQQAAPPTSVPTTSRGLRPKAPERRPPVVHQPVGRDSTHRSRSTRRHGAVPGPKSRGDGNVGSNRRKSSTRRSVVPRNPAVSRFVRLTAPVGGGAGRGFRMAIVYAPVDAWPCRARSRGIRLASCGRRKSRTPAMMKSPPAISVTMRLFRSLTIVLLSTLRPTPQSTEKIAWVVPRMNLQAIHTGLRKATLRDASVGQTA